MFETKNSIDFDIDQFNRITYSKQHFINIIVDELNCSFQFPLVKYLDIFNTFLEIINHNNNQWIELVYEIEELGIYSNNNAQSKIILYHSWFPWPIANVNGTDEKKSLFYTQYFGNESTFLYSHSNTSIKQYIFYGRIKNEPKSQKKNRTNCI